MNIKKKFINFFGLMILTLVPNLSLGESLSARDLINEFGLNRQNRESVNHCATSERCNLDKLRTILRATRDFDYSLAATICSFCPAEGSISFYQMTSNNSRYSFWRGGHPIHRSADAYHYFECINNRECNETTLNRAYHTTNSVMDAIRISKEINHLRHYDLDLFERIYNEIKGHPLSQTRLSAAALAREIATCHHNRTCHADDYLRFRREGKNHGEAFQLSRRQSENIINTTEEILESSN